MSKQCFAGNILLYCLNAAAIMSFSIPSPCAFAQESMAGNEEAKVDSLFAKSYELMRQGRDFEARQILEKAETLAPYSPAIHYNLGAAYEHSENINQALKEFSTVLKLRPHMSSAMLNIASCYQAQGKNDQAVFWYDQFLKENPKNTAAAPVAAMIKMLEAESKSKESLPDPTKPDYFSQVSAKGTFFWPQNKMPIKVFVAEGTAAETSLLDEAFAEWAKASGDKIAFVHTGSESQADVKTSFIADSKGHVPAISASECGLAEIHAQDGKIESASLVIVTKSPATGKALSNDQIKKICLHEIGHLLGLQGHSTNNHDVMFATIDTPTVWPLLSKRDVATINQLYRSYPSILTSPVVPCK